jgi:hypothetical protein
MMLGRHEKTQASSEAGLVQGRTQPVPAIGHWDGSALDTAQAIEIAIRRQGARLGEVVVHVPGEDPAVMALR